MTAYLDTHVLLWTLEGSLKQFSSDVLQALNQAELLVSPVVLLELEYLHEIGRIALTSREVRLKAEHELGVAVCDLAFLRVAEAALDEKWTRDPFDRIIVAQAKARGFSALITADQGMRDNYSMALWETSPKGPKGIRV